MKALLINGSPHESGCTYTALAELARALAVEGIESEIIQAGRTNISCNACGVCKKANRCVHDDLVNEVAQKFNEADALGGNTATFDALNKYFTICGMPIASSQYWNMVYGNTPEEVMQDQEGLQTMRTLGRNMAFLMKSIRLGKEQFGLPEKEPTINTNFHR